MLKSATGSPFSTGRVAEMADTGAYFHAAYVVGAVLYVAYVASLVSRRRRVLRRLAELEGHRR